jgi:hypothetical protein
MRRLLPILLCVAASTGLPACDQESVSEPTTDQEQALYDAARASPFNVPPGLADGDVSLSRPAGDDGGGGDIIVFIILDSVARNALGEPIQLLSDGEITDPDGVLLCTKGTSGGFTQLRDSDGDVLFSSVGPFVFEGQPMLAGKNPVQQAVELANHLRFSYDHDVLVEGFGSSGEDMVEASVPIQFSSGWRKLTIAALVDGYCGSEGIPE